MHQARRLLFRWRPAGVPVLLAVSAFLVLAQAVAAFAATPAAGEFPGCSATGFPRTVVDGLGNEIYLPEPPRRIFSATLATDSILLSIADPNRVVGVTLFAADPSQSAVADKVADHMVQVEHLNSEVVLATQPDLVLVAFFSNPDAVRQIRNLGLNVYTFTGFSRLLDVIENIERMGEITGCDAAAAAVIDDVLADYGRVAAAIASQLRPSVLWWDTWGSTAGVETTIHDVIQMAGGENAAARHGITGWKEIDVEAIIAIDPEVIITSYGEEFVQSVLRDPVLQSVRAVRTGRVYHVNHTDALDHHIFRAVEELARLLHPEAFQ